jgi:parvulin-like peptidyl-prolyl isomerase
VTKIKNNIIFIIKASSALIVFLTLVLFIYAAFFFDKTSIEKSTLKNEIVKEEGLKEEERLTEEKKLKEKEKQKIQEKNLDKKIKTTLKDGLYATVGNKAITRSDILNEIKSILILNNMTYSEDTRSELQQMAVKAVIKKNIKEIEINKHDFLEFSQSDLNFHLNRIAKNANMDLVTLKDICIANGLDFSFLEDKMKIELLWNSLVFQIYRNKISVDPTEIDKQLKLNLNKKEFNEYLISEIMVKAVEEDKLESMINDIKKRIELESFKNVAMKLSLSESAANGGDLGWLSEKQLSETFRLVLSKTPVGSISKAILVKENILIFKVRDKRKIEKKINLEDLKNQLVESEKTKMLNMYSRQHYENLKRIVSVKFFDE